VLQSNSPFGKIYPRILQIFCSIFRIYEVADIRKPVITITGDSFKHEPCVKRILGLESTGAR
jgi:hypothetical protein